MGGVLIYGHEVRTVRLCGQAKTYWLHMSTEQHNQLRSQVNRISKEPYQELYSEFYGAFTDDFSGEFAKGYDGTIELQKVHSLSEEIPASCKRP
jgi:hypothetical protein